MNKKQIEQSNLLVDFIIFLRLTNKSNISDTSLVYAISSFLNIDFDIANKSVTEALNDILKPLKKTYPCMNSFDNDESDSF